MKTLILIHIVFAVAACAAESIPAVLARGAELVKNRKPLEAVELYRNSLTREMTPSQRRMMLNRLGSLCLWDKSGVSRQYLLRALMVQYADATETYRTQLIFGHYYKARKEYEIALGCFLAFGENEKRIHPALRYNGYYEAGRIYEDHRLLKDALANYEKSVAAGKEVKYPINIQPAVNAVAKLKNNQENTQ